MTGRDLTLDGGPAFPAPALGQNGMTLRDYFAAMAFADIAGRFSWHEADIKKAAELAYQMADAMLTERAK